MKNTRLFTVLWTFSRVELNRLRKFVHSPYHNSHPEVRQLFDLIKEFLSQSAENKADRLEKEALFRAIYPLEAYDDLKFRHLVSYLMDIVREYLIAEEFKVNSIGKEPFLIRAYNRRELPDMVDATFKRAWKGQEKAKIRDHFYHFNNIQIYREAFNLDMQRRENAMPTIQQFARELDLYYIINKLQAACSLLSSAECIPERLKWG